VILRCLTRWLALAMLSLGAACGCEDESGAGATASQNPTPKPALPAPSPQSSLPALALQIEGLEAKEVLAGTPLVFTVSLSAAEDGRDVEIDDWVARLRLEDAETGAALDWQAAPLGAPRVWSFVEGAVPGAEGSARRARLAAGRIYETELGVAPEVVAQLTPGTYAVRATLENAALTAAARSEPVKLVVRPAAEATPALERERRLATVRFALRAGRGEQAERLAREGVALEPEQVEAHLLLGEALAQLGRDTEALVAYREALARVQPRGRHEEAPELLLDRIEAAERRLAGSEASAAP
jgi:tetratricopeptide (TPR) repeat protein